MGVKRYLSETIDERDDQDEQVRLQLQDISETNNETIGTLFNISNTSP